MEKKKKNILLKENIGGKITSKTEMHFDGKIEI